MAEIANPQLQKLVTLQELDSQVIELNAQLALIPGQIASSEQELEGKKGKLHALKAEMDSLQKKRAQSEQDVKAENDRMAKTKQKLADVKTNKEYSAIVVEIDAIKASISKIEDGEIEIMELLEAKETEIPPLQKEFEGFENEFKEYKAKKEAEQARVKQELEALNAKREQLTTDIEPRWLAHYNKVLKLREDRAVAPIVVETCQGCFHQIQPQIALEIRTDATKLHMCQYCSRFLYSIPEPAAENNPETAVPK